MRIKKKTIPRNHLLHHHMTRSQSVLNLVFLSSTFVQKSCYYHTWCDLNLAEEYKYRNISWKLSFKIAIKNNYANMVGMYNNSKTCKSFHLIKKHLWNKRYGVESAMFGLWGRSRKPYNTDILISTHKCIFCGGSPCPISEHAHNPFTKL